MSVPTYDQFIEPILRYLAATPEVFMVRFVGAAQEGQEILRVSRQEGRVMWIAPQGEWAMREKKQALLLDYNSPSSQSVSNRLVEPFAFNERLDTVYGYEPSSRKNKFE